MPLQFETCDGVADMTSTQWLLQSNHPNLSTIREIAAILRDQGNAVHMVPLKGHSTELPDLSMLDALEPVVCYGPSFVPRAFAHPSLNPGVFFDPDTFLWSSFRSGWEEMMLSTGRVVPAVAAPDVVGAKSFVRPDQDSKAFDGGLFDAKSMAETIDLALMRGLLQPDTPVVVAEPVRVDAEWRTFIVGGEVVAASSYRRDGVGDISLHVPHAVVDMAFEAAERWRPADVFCLDIALSGDRYGIVEANCFNASRFYGADAAAVLSAVSTHVSVYNRGKDYNCVRR
ncbi:hypothetical protein D3C71_376820 [compost metagenome]